MDTLLPLKLPPGMRNTGTVYQSKGRWYTGNFVRFFQDTIQPIGGWAARDGVLAVRTTDGLMNAHAETPVTGISTAFDTSHWTAATNITASIVSNRLSTNSSVNTGIVRYTNATQRATWMVQSVCRTPSGTDALVGPVARAENQAAPNDYVYAYTETSAGTGNVGIREIVAGVQATDDSDPDAQAIGTYYRISLATTTTTATSHHFDDATTRTIALSAGETTGNVGVYHGTSTGAETCEHQEFYVMRGRYLTVNGPGGRNWTAQVLDANDVVLTSAAATTTGVASVDMLTVEFPEAVGIKVIDTDNANAELWSAEPTSRLWGGDVWTWSDGIPEGFGTWSPEITPPNLGWTAVAASTTSAMLVAVGNNGIDPGTYSSPDGETWTARSAPGWDITKQFNDVIWVEDLNLFVAVGTTDAQTSPDGTTWTLRTSAGGQTRQAVVWDGTTLFAYSATMGVADDIMTSTDGITWGVATSSGLSGTFAGNIVWSATRSLFVATLGTSIYTSTNGIAWTLREAMAYTGSAKAQVVWSELLGKFFVLAGPSVADPTHSAVWASTNGTAWTRQAFQQTTLTAPTVLALAEGIDGGADSVLLVMESGSATYLYSSDGETWTSGTGFAKNWGHAVWSSVLGLFFATGTAGSTTDFGTVTYALNASGSIAGVPRAMVSYRLNNDTQVVVVGTTSNLYAIIGTTIFDITPATVTTNNIARVWQLDVFGSYLVAVDLIAPSTAGAAYYWAGDTGDVAVALSPFDGTTPTSALSVVATPERFLTILGGKYTASGWTETGSVSRSRLVTWATQEGGFTGSDWVPGATNTAGDFELTTDGALVSGRRTRGGTLLWTTTDLWLMAYIGGTFVYRFDQLGNKCGLIAPNAAIVTDTAAYWMGQNGFYVYDGFVRPVPCEVHDYVFNSLNRTYTHYIWAIENPTFGEVTWFYPHAAQTEVTRYVTYNYRENHWVTGTLERTTGIALQPGTTVYPVMADASGVIFDHETASARNSEGTPSLESGPVEIADGDRLMGIQKVIPDDKTVGDVTLTLYTAPNPDTAETTNGPYTLTAQTSIRVKARQVRMKLTEAVATAWRVGVVRLGVVLGSRR